MTPVPMQCPICAGMIQIDPAYAGQQVVCPLCQGVRALPPPEFFGLAPGPLSQPYPPPGYLPEFPPQFTQEPPANLPQLGCPVCGGAFQVSPEMVGQQVACPHCQNAVSIPDIFGGFASGMSPAPMQPAQQEMVTGPMQFIGLPPGMSAAPELPPSVVPPTDLDEPGIPIGMAVTAAQQPLPTEPPSHPVADLNPPASQRKASAATGEARESRTGDVDANLYPPGMTRKEAAAPKKEPPATPRDDRFPPGMGKPRDRDAAKRPRPITEREQLYPPGFKPREEAQTTPAQGQPPIVDDLLPPGASAAAHLPSAVDDLLPPGAAEAASAAGPESPSRGQDVVDALLPPGAPTDPAAMPTEQVALPDAPAPTPDSDYVTVENKEGVKTISSKGEEIEIRKLSPEERARRRRVKNIVMFTLAVLVLVVVIVIMTRK